MKTNMSAREIEAMIVQKVEKDNKDAIAALRAKQQEELKVLRATLAKKKRQEFRMTVDEVGKYVIGKFDKDGHHNTEMTTDDYKKWIDEMIAFVQAHSQE